MNITYNKISTKLTRSYILKVVSKYGFIECCDVSAFLNFVCRDEFIHLNECGYIYAKINQCLKSNMSKSYSSTKRLDELYFKELSDLQRELEYVMSVKPL